MHVLRKVHKSVEPKKHAIAPMSSGGRRLKDIDFTLFGAMFALLVRVELEKTIAFGSQL